MKKNSILVKHVLMSALTAATFGLTIALTACSDDLDLQSAPVEPQTELTDQTRAGSSDYNINEHYITYGSNEKEAKPFDTKNWQNETAIFCYVGSAQGDDNIYDTKTQKKLSGFKLVNLPWSDNAAATNLPPEVYEEIMPKAGVLAQDHPWKLVLMNCGAENVPNGNFLGFYNELSGILRVFVFVPETTESQSSTHLWGLLLNDKLASRSLFRYGVPVDKNITSQKSKSVLKQGNQMSQIVSPWKAGEFSGFNENPLSPGWWAFDMDLSQYRNPQSDQPFTNLDPSKPVLTVKTLCKTDAQLKMDSKMTAKIKGEMQLKATQASTSSGIFAPLEELLGKANDVASLVDIAKSVIDPNPLSAIENGIKLAKGACDLVGIDYGKTEEGFNGYKGSANFALDGNIETDGIISNQGNVNGFFPISFKKGNFLTENCPSFGEGVWNLKSSPVVYYTNAYVDWRYQHDGNTSCNWYDRKSPFKGQLNNGEGTNAPYHGQVCYFDPNSIQLTLNPTIFSQSERDNAKVYATCGVRKDMKFGDTETYRNAIGLAKSQINFEAPYAYPNRPFDEAPFDALSSQQDKMNKKAAMTFDENIYNGKKYGVFGRGDADYLIEPQALCGKDAPIMMPAYEVTVTVVVTRDNGKKIVYTRTYLPEYKEMHIENMRDLKSLQDRMPTHYAPEVYKQQIAHVNDIRNWTRRCLHPTNGTYSHQYVWRPSTNGTCYDGNKKFDSLTESYATLFDNDLSNRWCVQHENMWFDVKCVFNQVHSHNVISGRSVIKNNGWSNHPCWFAEFMTNLPSNPTSYKLISSNDAGKYGGCNPRVWALYGKEKQDDEWTLLGMSSYNNQPQDMLPKKNSAPTRALPFRFHDAKGMKYYRFEVLDVADEHLMRLGEIRFNYD